MTRLVSIIGRSPGTLHTVLCLLEQQGTRPDEIILVATDPEVAREAAEIATGCPCPGTGEPPAAPEKIKIDLLPYSDITSQQQLRHYQRRVAEHLTPDTILDLTGGRKIMAIAATAVAAARGTPIVTAQLPWSKYLEIADAEDPCSKTQPQHAVLLHI